MEDKNYGKGIIFALISLFLVSLQPIVAISRPRVLDAYIFAAMTCIVESIIFLPLILIERQKLKSEIEKEPSKSDELHTLLNGWKKNKKILLYIGINFAIAQILFYVAYELAGAINGSLAQQTMVIFALLFGFLIHHEKISKTQILFSFLLLFGLTLAVTQGNFNVLEINLGVLVMFITTMLWMLAHSITKPILEKEITPIQFSFIRYTISGIFLICTYFIFYPITNISLLFEPINILFFLLIGFLYGFDVLFWYKSLSHIEMSKVSVLVSPMPILVAFFAFIILGESFTIFHLLGTIVIIFSIIMIVKKRPAKIIP
ncbi:MAG: EamA family transporter [Promethearchaeota archaeon]|nr:MAG: EamA family transporter [Candidatus Lokiarchaeota archaeon]